MRFLSVVPFTPKKNFRIFLHKHLRVIVNLYPVLYSLADDAWLVVIFRIKTYAFNTLYYNSIVNHMFHMFVCVWVLGIMLSRFNCYIIYVFFIVHNQNCYVDLFYIRKSLFLYTFKMFVANISSNSINSIFIMAHDFEVFSGLFV